MPDPCNKQSICSCTGNAKADERSDRKTVVFYGVYGKSDKDSLMKKITIAILLLVLLAAGTSLHFLRFQGLWTFL